jgi:glycosyltransferase involved in cell wall biosynthesis
MVRSRTSAGPIIKHLGELFLVNANSLRFLRCSSLCAYHFWYVTWYLNYATGEARTMRETSSNEIVHSIVIPVYNEAQGLGALFNRMKKVVDGLDSPCEVILVNDGSKDGSSDLLDQLNAKDKRFKVLHLSRNFGHQIAITAGIEWASGRTVTVMDADLQDPPELIYEFIKQWKDGFEVVYAQRRARVGESFFKMWTAKMFYRVIRSLSKIDIPVDTGDFRLMDRKVVDAYLSMPEKNRYVRGLITWVGFKQTGVLFDREERKHGETHYPLKKMVKLAFDGITSFSVFPLKLATWMGFTVTGISFLFSIYALYQHFIQQVTIQGWTSMMLVISFLGGAQLFALGMIGEYVGRIFDETRQRPLYFVGKVTGLDKPKA